MVKVIYLSHAQNKKIDPKKLGLSADAVGIRGGQGSWEDPMFRAHYATVLESGLPFFIWWFCQPNMTAGPQINAFMKLWDSLPVKPVAIGYDVEEIDYLDNNGVMQKLFPPSRQFNHDNVLEFCKKVHVATGAKVGIYTRKKYFETWTFETMEWYLFWLWIAAWFVYTGQVKPLLPWKWKEYKIHQFEGGSFDDNLGVYTCKEYFNGTIDECAEFFGSEVDTMPPVVFTPYEVVTTVDWLTVCMGPGSNYEAVSWIPKGTLVKIEEETSGWGRYAVGWISLAYTKRVDLVVVELTDHEILMKIWAAHPELHPAA